MPHRIHDEDNVRHLKLMGDLGMINSIPFHARDTDSIAAAVEKSNVVINLLGMAYVSCVQKTASGASARESDRPGQAERHGGASRKSRMRFRQTRWL